MQAMLVAVILSVLLASSAGYRLPQGFSAVASNRGAALARSQCTIVGTTVNRNVVKCKNDFSLQQSKDIASMDRPVIVVGSGPVGLATAVMLAKQGVRAIEVYDQLTEPPNPFDSSFWGSFQAERSYNIGVSGRGREAMKALGVMPLVDAVSAELYGAASWTPSSPNPTYMQQIRKSPTKCLERDRLTGCFLHWIRQNYADVIKVRFHTQCTDVTWHEQGSDNEHCTVQLVDKVSNEVIICKTNFLVGADGANSKVRDCMQAKDASVTAKQYEDVNPYEYRTFPIAFPRSNYSHFCPESQHLTFSARTKSGMNLEALPTKEGVHLGVVLYRPDTPEITAIKTAADARQFFDTNFPMTKGCISEQGYEKFANSKDCRFPKFQYTFPKLHIGQSTVLLGDSIHCVKPYFGLGVNSGLEDVLVLQKMLQKHSSNVKEALEDFSETRAKEAKALVYMSQRLDRGIIYFVLPLIIDRLFNKVFPFFSTKTVIALMQDESLTFTQALRRKFLDRILQIGVVGGAMSGFFRALQFLFKLVVKTRNPSLSIA